MRKVYMLQNENANSVKVFLENADIKTRSKFQSVLSHITHEKNGLCEPYVRHISQNRFKDIYEIRVKVSETMVRVIFLKSDNDIILLYAFYKHDKKDTKIALERVLKLLKDESNYIYEEVVVE